MFIYPQPTSLTINIFIIVNPRLNCLAIFHHNEAERLLRLFYAFIETFMILKIDK